MAVAADKQYIFDLMQLTHRYTVNYSLNIAANFTERPTGLCQFCEVFNNQY